jgi:Uma2 family endonuclease
VSSATTSKVIPIGSDEAAPSQGPGPLVLAGPFAHVPPLAEIERLTEVPDRRVVFRGVDWAFYDQLVESIPEQSNIHVDYDGRDVEIMGKGRTHGKVNGLLGQLLEAIAQELRIAYSSAGDTTWKRPDVSRGLEADRCYYFLPEKISADEAALERGSDDLADYPNPDLAIEVDISPPQVDRAGIYAALRVTEIWRFDGKQVVIERLAANGKYVAVEASGFLPIRADEITRWVVDGARGDESAWAMRLRAEIRTRTSNKNQGHRPPRERPVHDHGPQTTDH